MDMGMIKVEPGSTGFLGSMGPPLPIAKEESVDTFKARGGRGRGGNVIAGGRKRKDRDSEGEDNAGNVGRKRSRG